MRRSLPTIGVIALLLCLAAFIASHNRGLMPTRFQNLVEWLVESLYDFVVGILGPKHGPRSCSWPTSTRMP